MVPEATRTTRRTVLRGGLLAAGLAGIAGLVGLGERLQTRIAASPVPAPGSTLTLYGTGWRLSAPGLRRGDLPKRGDLVMVTGALSLEQGAQPTGDFFGSTLHLDGTGGHGSYASVQQETHTFRMPGGSIVGIGANAADGESVFVIAGGTGRFAGLSGTYTARQSPIDVGGDGSAEFTFTFNSGR